MTLDNSRPCSTEEPRSRISVVLPSSSHHLAPFHLLLCSLGICWWFVIQTCLNGVSYLVSLTTVQSGTSWRTGEQGANWSLSSPPHSDTLRLVKELAEWDIVEGRLQVTRRIAAFVEETSLTVSWWVTAKEEEGFSDQQPNQKDNAGMRTRPCCLFSNVWSSLRGQIIFT